MTAVKFPSPIYGIYGSGRAARHLDHYLTQSGQHVLRAARKTHPDFSQAAQALAPADVIWVLISDREIESAARALQAEFQALCLPSPKIWLHASGSLVIPGVAGFHPLMSFGEELYPLQTYREMAFIGEDEWAEQGLDFTLAFPALPNPFYAIPQAQKPLYHALCVMAGNFTVLLWQKLFSDFQTRLGIPAQVAIPYLERIAQNLRQNPEAALTGPLARQDHATIGKNRDALEGDHYQAVYSAFVQAYQPHLPPSEAHPS